MMLFWNLIFCSIFKTALTMEKSSLKKKKAKRMVYGALVFAWHKLTDTYWFLSFHRVLDYEQRQRLLSDSTDLNSPGAFTAEKLRKTQSYTAFPHINKKSTYFDNEPSFNFTEHPASELCPIYQKGPLIINIFQQSPFCHVRPSLKITLWIWLVKSVANLKIQDGSWR